jgi:hypothetical protein
MRCNNPKMCAECPFRKDSAKGWLGPWDDSDEIINQSQNESGLACHMRIEHEENGEVSYDDTHVCVGSMAYANATCKVYRAPTLREAQKKVAQTVKDEEILSNREDFSKHHDD